MLTRPSPTLFPYTTLFRSPSELAVEYTVLDLQVNLDEIEPWDPIDSLAWLKAMAWDLKNNFDQELDRALVMAEVNDVGREIGRASCRERVYVAVVAVDL